MPCGHGAGPGGGTQAPRPPAQTRIFGLGFVKAFGCFLAVGGFIAGNTALILKIKRLGGIVKVVKRLWKARSAEQRAVLIAKLFGAAAGTAAVAQACTP